MSINDGLNKMEENGWSLVQVKDRWYFAHFTGGDVQVNHGILRMGHWPSPQEALLALSQRDR